MIQRLIYIGIMLFVIQSCNKPVSDYEDGDESISISPDYTGITLPNNIAPLNFYIHGEGEAFNVEISSANGKSIIINSNTPNIQIPLKKWKRLLSENRGEAIEYSIYMRNQGNWTRVKSFSSYIAEESIHPYLAYRLINTQYAYTSSMKFAQRHLESFDETLIFKNNSSNTGCFNCHSFSNYDPDQMSMHFRQSFGGTVITDGDKIVKLNTKTPNTLSPFGYVGSNPNGELIAYSTNKFNEYYTNSGSNLNEVTDQESDIVVYNRKTNIVTTSPKISTNNRENFPSWGPDGKFLYYLSADEAFSDFNSRFYSYYSLVRISYDQKENVWGEPDTLYNARKEGKSLTFPRVSPDGKKIMFCLIDYGYFSINHQESDLYLMDIASREYEKLNINSDYNESYHAWSQDGRWVVFSSKRYNQEYSAPHFVYYDQDGKFHKPFILPQKDPLFYETFLLNYNIPEFINGKVDLKPNQIRDILYQDAQDVIFDPEVDLDALNINSKDRIIQDSDNTSIHERK